MKKIITINFLSILFLFSFLFSGSATGKGLEACFLASDSCEAYQSFRKKTNPEGVRLESGKFYKILEKNKNKTAYRIRVEGIKRSARWVSKRCGEASSACSLKKGNLKADSKADFKNKSNQGSNKSSALISQKTKQTDVQENAQENVQKDLPTNVQTKKIKKYKVKSKKNRKQPEYLLALSWQPSFCETHSRKKECRSQTRNRYDATHWSLHGLWPQPRSNVYCGVGYMDKGIDRNKKWHLLAPVKLSQKTATELAFIMPATASNLQRHEWIKHGTCYGSDAEDYYSDAISLTNQINNSIVGKLFNRGVGKKVSLKQVRAHFDKAFGKGAGKKVDMRCDKKGRVSELWINLKGEVLDDTKIASLLKDSIRAGSSCQIGVIDPANR